MWLPSLGYWENTLIFHVSVFGSSTRGMRLVPSRTTSRQKNCPRKPLLKAGQRLLLTLGRDLQIPSAPLSRYRHRFCLECESSWEHVLHLQSWCACTLRKTSDEVNVHSKLILVQSTFVQCNTILHVPLIACWTEPAFIDLLALHQSWKWRAHQPWSPQKLTIVLFASSRCCNSPITWPTVCNWLMSNMPVSDPSPPRLAG